MTVSEFRSALAYEPRILDHFAEDFARSGVVGEERGGKLLYLATTSRLLERPVCILVKAPTSAGKSFTVQKVLTFFPDTAYVARTAMSERALAYTNVDLRHRMLVLNESHAVSGETGYYLVRSLLSEGRIDYEVTERNGAQWNTRRITKEGPTGLLMTTTALHIHPENETRMLSLSVNDTSTQTQEIMMVAAEAASGIATTTQTANVDFGRWHEFQGWLAGGERRVVVPFAPALAQLVRPLAIRLRRDFMTILTLVRTHALLHQATRERDSQGQIIASLDDYAVVHSLVADLVAEGIESSVPITMRQTVEAVMELSNRRLNYPVELNALTERLQLDKSTVSRRVGQAIDRGYLYNIDPSPGRPAQIIVGEPLPTDTDVLPTVEALAERVRCCSVASVAGDMEGEETSPTRTHTTLEVIEI